MENTVDKKRSIIFKILVIAEKKVSDYKDHSKGAQERANEEEGAMQSRYSTFKEEGQYLADALRAKYEEYKVAVSIIKNIQNENITKDEVARVLSLIAVEFEDGEIENYFIFPVLGREKIDNFLLISPNAPITKALMGKEKGDEFQFFVGKTEKKGEIKNVE